MYDTLAMIALGAFLLSLGYVAVALTCVLRFRRRLAHAMTSRVTAPVTLLKPLCGLECEMADNLRSFCRQDYGTYQIVFGVRDADDPAIAVVDALRAEFPERDIALVVSDRIIGSNPKVSNLANMMAAAKHDLLIISDSDMRVAPNYISSMVAPFRAADVGVTTCLYSASARGGIASELGAMFINDWFFPSSLVAVGFGELKFCFGATMAIRRDVLKAIGGFPALADHIADDYMLGRLANEDGYRIALAPYIIENIVHEPSLKSLFVHEIRWARTIRSVQPLGYTCSLITEFFALSLLAGLALYGAGTSVLLALAPIGAALALRWALHHAVWLCQPAGRTYTPWLIPIRDLFTLAVRVCSYFGSTVTWREQILTVRRRNNSRKRLHEAVSS